MAQTLATFRTRLLSRLVPDVSEATAETIEILADVDQVTQLLASFDELYRGRIVALDQAFSDL